MSRSPSEPENAAPASSMSQDQGLGDSSSSDRNKPKRWAPTSQKHSSSLLTQALAAHQEAEEVIGPPRSVPDSSTAAPPSHSGHPRHQPNNGIKTREDTRPSRERMAMEALETSHDIRSSRYLESRLKATQAPLGQSDRNTVEASLATYRELLNNNRGRGTSLERTEKEKRVQDSPKGTYSTNPGDTALPPSLSTTSSSTALDTISTNPPTDGVRAKYRSWRDSLPEVAPEKAWSIGDDRTDDMLGGQVEKSIKNAMAGIEPNNRSRKASHSLRFFKEGLPDDKSKKRDGKGRTRSKDGRSETKTAPRPSPLPLRLAGVLPDSDFESHSPISSPLEGSVLSSKLSAKTSSPSLTPDSTAEAPSTHDYFDSSVGHDIISDEQIQSLPSALHAEIRNQHNLTPGAAKGSSFSRSIPVTASERTRPDVHDEGKKTVEDNLHDGGNYFDGDRLSDVRNPDEEDESGEEQISSAVFVPHKTPHDSPERDRSGLHSPIRPRIQDSKQAKDQNSQEWLEEYEVPSRDVSQKYLSQEPKPRPTPSPTQVKPQSPYSEKGIYFSEPEVLSDGDTGNASESGYTTAEGESSVADDQEPTPTSSLKQENLSNHIRQIHDHQQAHRQPLEAIELIPYRHQVGGHTTMWRFSKRAVCKQLNNRENEFYEKIERYHPQLLKFLPRYIAFQFHPHPHLVKSNAESFQRPCMPVSYSFV
jgi:inositol-hexakisphosphate kinase